MWIDVYKRQEFAEKGKRAQLAYSFNIALQNELTMEENVELAREFCREQFVSRGMIVDMACLLYTSQDKRKIYSNGRFKEVKNINAYLLEAPNRCV